MRIMIAGGSGLIGRALTNSFSNDGDEIIILSRTPGKVRDMPYGVRVLPWDGKTIQGWAVEIENTKVIINLTGENLSGERFFPSRLTKARKKRLLESRVNSGRVLSTAVEMAKNKPSVFIQSSGVSYYGTDLHKQFIEESQGGNDFLSNLCKEWEASSQAVESMGVRRVIIRNAIVLSTISGALPRLLLPYKLYVGGPMGTGKQVYSWIHMDDEVNAIRFLIEHDEAIGVYNLSSPHPVTNNEFGKAIAKVMKRPHYFPLPGFLLYLAFGEVTILVLEGQNVIPKKLLDLGYKFKYPTIEEALKNTL